MAVNTVAPKAEAIPPEGTPITDPSWQKWFYSVYNTTLKDGGVFPKMALHKNTIATFTLDDEEYEVVTLDKGFYCKHTTTIGNIAYGFATNVVRAAGNNLVVGAQINAWKNRGVSTTAFGVATEARSMPGSDGSCVGIETSIINMVNTNVFAKRGLDVVFKDREDSQTGVYETLGSNRYNCNSQGITFTSQSRSTAGEFCGWSIAMLFIGDCLDFSSPPAWNNTTVYGAGQKVTSGGKVWIAQVVNVNVVPAGAPTWIQHSINTTDGAVGIDFTAMTNASALTRMKSAIRMRDETFLHWDETGVIGTTFDAANGRLVLCDNNGNRRFQIDVANGDPWFGNGTIGLGGGAGATLGTVGGGGPGAAGQAVWATWIDGTTGATYYVPLWQ